MKDKRRKAQHTLWTTGRVGTLTPWSQSKVWALAKAWAATYPESDYGRNTWIKGLVEAVTKDKRRKARPTEEAIGKLIAKIEADPSWFPGKVHGSLGGAPQQIPRLNKATVARSAMAWKKSGGEPTYPSTIARNEKAALNPVTGAPMSPAPLQLNVDWLYLCILKQALRRRGRYQH